MLALLQRVARGLPASTDTRTARSGSAPHRDDSADLGDAMSDRESPVLGHNEMHGLQTQLEAEEEEEEEAEDDHDHFPDGAEQGDDETVASFQIRMALRKLSMPPPSDLAQPSPADLAPPGADASAAPATTDVAADPSSAADPDVLAATLTSGPAPPSAGAPAPRAAPRLAGEQVGFLWKKGSTRHNWKRRFFILSFARRTLTYFDAPGGKSLGSMLLDDAAVVDMQPSAQVRRKQHVFQLCISSPLRELFVAAGSALEKQEWEAALRRAISPPVAAPVAPVARLRCWVGTWNLGAKDPFLHVSAEQHCGTLAGFVPQGYDLYVLGVQEAVGDSVFRALAAHTRCERLPLFALSAEPSGGRRLRSEALRLRRATNARMLLRNSQHDGSLRGASGRVTGRGDGSLVSPKFTGIAMFIRRCVPRPPAAVLLLPLLLLWQLTHVCVPRQGAGAAPAIPGRGEAQLWHDRGVQGVRRLPLASRACSLAHAAAAVA